MISTFCNTHPLQKCHVNVIRDTVMEHKRNRLRSGIDVRNRVSVVRITFHGNIWEKSSFSYGVLNVVLRFSFLVVSSNFVKWIQNSCHWIRFHTLLFVISNRVSFGVFVLRILLWIRKLLFQHLEILLSSCLSGLLFSYVYFLDKILC